MKSTFITILLLVASVFASFAPIGTASADEEPLFRGVMSWGNYPNHVSTLGFDTQGPKASGTANTWNGRNPFQFTNLDRVNERVSWRDIVAQLDGVYASDIYGYWHDSVCTGLTFYYYIEPTAPPEERYTVWFLNTTGRDDLRIYWQSRHVKDISVFKGRSADLQIYITDQDGRWNTCAGITLYPR